MYGYCKGWEEDLQEAIWKEYNYYIRFDVDNR